MTITTIYWHLKNCILIIILSQYINQNLVILSQEDATLDEYDIWYNSLAYINQRASEYDSIQY